jgi:4-diphosphocytidyl-2-C-methyl-D-erythritol kinase
VGSVFRVRRAPAKLNLVLELTGRRPDGYHLLSAVSQTVAWNDVVGVELAGSQDPEDCRLVVAGPHAQEVPKGGENIVLRTRELLRAMGLGLPISQVVLEKRIPTKSGLGGGSADAAALISLATQGLPDQAVSEVALKCGADVPFALLGGAAQVGGVGEELKPLPSLTRGVFLVTHLGEVSTAAAYRAVLEEDFSQGQRAALVAEALSRARLPDPELLGSSLLPAALRVTHGLASALERLREATPGVYWAMTGSGGAFFSLFADQERALGTLVEISSRCPDLLVRAVLPEPAWPGPS